MVEGGGALEAALTLGEVSTQTEAGAGEFSRRAKLAVKTRCAAAHNLSEVDGDPVRGGWTAGLRMLARVRATAPFSAWTSPWS